MNNNSHALLPSKPIVEILIASPSDVLEIRKKIPRIFNSWNATHEFAHLSAVEYESHSAPQMGAHPQHILNKQLLDRCQLLIAIFWHKIGTPTPDAPSGTISEIREFSNRKGPQRVMLYFCNRPSPHEIDELPIDEIQVLQQFKKEMQSTALYCDFKLDEEFEANVYRHLETHVRKLVDNQLDRPISEQRKTVAESREDFGSDMRTIADVFARRVEGFISEGGGSPSCYLDAGRDFYNEVAAAIDGWLLRSYNLKPELRYGFDSISNALKVLAQDSNAYLIAFPSFWLEGKAISDKLLTQIRFMESQ